MNVERLNAQTLLASHPTGGTDQAVPVRTAVHTGGVPIRLASAGESAVVAPAAGTPRYVAPEPPPRGTFVRGYRPEMDPLLTGLAEPPAPRRSPRVRAYQPFDVTQPVETMPRLGIDIPDIYGAGIGTISDRDPRDVYTIYPGDIVNHRYPGPASLRPDIRSKTPDLGRGIRHVLYPARAASDMLMSSPVPQHVRPELYRSGPLWRASQPATRPLPPESPYQVIQEEREPFVSPGLTH